MTIVTLTGAVFEHFTKKQAVTFRLSGMKYFIISDDKKIVGKVLKGLKLADQKDNKLNLFKLKFSMNSYENLAKNKTKILPETVQDLFHLIHSFRKNKNITNFVNVWMLEDPIRKPTTVTWGPLQLYFYENPFFFPMKTAKYTVAEKWQILLLRNYSMNFLH